MIRNLKIIKTTPVFIVIWQVQKMQNVLTRFSHVWLFVTLWTVDHQAPLSMRFSRQKYWSGWPCPPPRDLPNPGIEPTSPTSPALAGGFFTTSTTWETRNANLNPYRNTKWQIQEKKKNIIKWPNTCVLYYKVLKSDSWSLLSNFHQVLG